MKLLLFMFCLTCFIGWPCCTLQQHCNIMLLLFITVFIFHCCSMGCYYVRPSVSTLLFVRQTHFTGVFGLVLLAYHVNKTNTRELGFSINNPDFKDYLCHLNVECIIINLSQSFIMLPNYFAIKSI